ncbi:MAG: HAD-IA family hydrolase [Erysipelotrichaceae bacterium]|nr:HAD-IA family hydrolase [Erysipelotrichaceae bacterium]
MRKYKAIIYDIDGTLLDTLKMNMIPLLKILHEEGLRDFTYETVLKYASYPGRKVLEELGIENREEVYARWVRYVNEFEEGASIYPGVVDLLKKVESMDIIQAVVSAKTYNQYRIDVVSKGLDMFMKCRVLAEDTDKHKPDPEPLLKCCELLGLKPKEVCYVGDAYSDYLASKEAHIDFFYAKWNGLHDERIIDVVELNHPLELIESII